MIMTLMTKILFQLQGQKPYLATPGEMGDISNCATLVGTSGFNFVKAQTNSHINEKFFNVLRAYEE